MDIKIVSESVKLSSNTSFKELIESENLLVAKNQNACIQIVFRSDDNYSINIGDSMGLTNQINDERYRITVTSELKSTLFNVGYLRDSNGVSYADMLTSQPVMNHPGSRVGSLWLDINVSKETKSGVYEVIIEVFVTEKNMDESKLCKRKIRIQVLESMLPDPKDYAIYLDLWQHNSNIARYYEVPLWSEQHFSLLEPVVSSLAELGQKSVMLVASECPWNGWGSFAFSKDETNLFEHSIIGVKIDKNGKIIVDFTTMQRYIDLCSRYTIDGDISIYGLLGVWNLPLYPHRTIDGYGETLQIRYLDEKTGMYKFMRTQSQIEDYITQIYNYFVDTNQIDKVRIAADEQKNSDDEINKFKTSINLIRRWAPRFKFKIAFDNDTVIDELEEYVSDTVTSFPCTTRRYDTQTGDRKLWYVCNIPDKPNTFLRSPLLETRAIGSLQKLFKYDGFLRWAYTCWTANPREDIIYSPSIFPVGDLCLIYPEQNGNVAKSIRWKMLKRGIEDFEIMKQLELQGKNDVVTDALNYVINHKNPKEFMKFERITVDDIVSYNQEDYDRMRMLLLNNL